MTHLIKNEIYKIAKKKATLILLICCTASLLFQLFFTKNSVFSIATDASFLNLFITILSASILSEEFSKKTIKTLLTKPYTRGEILLSKFLSLLLVAIILDLLQILIGYTIGLLSGKIAQLNLASMKEILFSIFITCCVQILFITITLAISFITNSKSIAITISVLFIFFGSVINTLLISQINSRIILLNPLNMLNINLLLNQEIPSSNMLPLWGYLVGIFFYASLFYSITYIILRKKEIIVS